MSDKKIRKIEITEEEYKELLDYKYKWINHQCETITITEPHKIYPYNPNIFPYTYTDVTFNANKE